MPVAVIDMGTNSTRLLVAEVEPPARVVELERRSTVTRLGRGVATSGKLAPEAIDEVCGVLADYLQLARGHEAEPIVAIATSAVRDAGNGAAFLAELRERFALEARLLDGGAEARLTYAGAVAGRRIESPTLVFDIGGGSTELVVGTGPDHLDFHESLQLGVVRHSERFLTSDPPRGVELEDMADSAGSALVAARGRYGGPTPDRAIAVAGTPTSLAAIELGLDPYDRDAVEGHELQLPFLQKQLGRLSSMPLAERRTVTGLHPDRAPTIVAGLVILVGTMRAFGLEKVEVSENDILLGAALEASAGPSA